MKGRAMRIDITAGTAAFLGTVLLLVAAEALHAQRGGPQGEDAETRTQRTPAIRLSVSEGLNEAQQCIEAEDFECAREELEDVRTMRSLSDYEAATLWMIYGSLYVSEDNYPEAIEAFENVLLQEEVTLAVEQNALYTLAQLYGQEERYEEALEALERWFDLSESPSPESYMLKANYHMLLNQHAEVIEPAETAIRLAIERGKAGEEVWHQILQLAYFELEDYANVVRVGATLLEHWPKKQHIVMLAGVYAELGEDDVQLALYEAAYEAGWLEGGELATLAQMLLQADIPYKAARILEQGLEDGEVEATEDNWRVLAQAWRLAQEDEKAIGPLIEASALSADGEIDMYLANAYANLARWEDCVESASTALQRGGFDRLDEAHTARGTCLVSLQRYGEAMEDFKTASRDPRSRRTAEQWLEHTRNAEEYDMKMAEMRESLRRASEQSRDPARVRPAFGIGAEADVSPIGRDTE